MLKNIQIGERNRTGSPEIDSHKYSQLIFHKRTKAAQGSEAKGLQENGAGTTGHPQGKKI